MRPRGRRRPPRAGRLGTCRGRPAGGLGPRPRRRRPARITRAGGAARTTRRGGRDRGGRALTGPAVGEWRYRRTVTARGPTGRDRSRVRTRRRVARRSAVGRPAVRRGILRRGQVRVRLILRGSVLAGGRVRRRRLRVLGRRWVLRRVGVLRRWRVLTGRLRVPGRLAGGGRSRTLLAGVGTGGLRRPRVGRGGPPVGIGCAEVRRGADRPAERSAGGPARQVAAPVRAGVDRRRRAGCGRLDHGRLDLHACCPLGQRSPPGRRADSGHRQRLGRGAGQAAAAAGAALRVVGLNSAAAGTDHGLARVPVAGRTGQAGPGRTGPGIRPSWPPTAGRAARAASGRWHPTPCHPPGRRSALRAYHRPSATAPRGTRRGPTARRPGP